MDTATLLRRAGRDFRAFDNADAAVATSRRSMTMRAN